MTLRQQINLYQPAMGVARQALSATTFFVAIGIVVLALVGLTLQAQFALNRMNAAVDVLRTQAASQQDALTQLSEVVPEEGKRNVDEDRIAQLTADLRARERALEVLRKGAAGQATGFAQRMEALARGHTEGVWLEHLQLSGVSGAMELNGVALNPSAVPQYLHNLSSEAALAGTRFDEFMIQRPEATPGDGDDESTKPVMTRIPQTAVRFRAASSDAPAPTVENPS